MRLLVWVPGEMDERLRPKPVRGKTVRLPSKARREHDRCGKGGVTGGGADTWPVRRRLRDARGGRQRLTQ
jgi:hypothetical protein